MNVFTLDKSDEETILNVWPAGFRLDPASPRNRREPDLFELCRMGIDGCHLCRIHASGVQGKDLRLSIIGGRLPSPVPEARGLKHLRS